MVDKLERLMDLVITLLETERLITADQIRSHVPGYPEKLESFRRAFERDKEELRDMGLPLEMDYLPGTDPPILGYRINKGDYYLPDPGLEPDELKALHLAAAMVDLEGIAGDDALWPLGGVPEQIGGGDLTTMGIALPGDPNLGSLFGAIQRRARISFGYGSDERVVDPYRLDLQSGWWYLTGLDHRHGEVRTFRVDRIEGSVDIDDQTRFERPDSSSQLRPSGAPWELGAGSPVAARLLVDAHRAAHAATTLGAEHIKERRDDGTLVFDVPVTNWPAFRSFVLGYLEHAELLGPEDWRNELIEWLEALCE